MNTFFSFCPALLPPLLAALRRVLFQLRLHERPDKESKVTRNPSMSMIRGFNWKSPGTQLGAQVPQLSSRGPWAGPLLSSRTFPKPMDHGHGNRIPCRRGHHMVCLQVCLARADCAAIVAAPMATHPAAILWLCTRGTRDPSARVYTPHVRSLLARAGGAGGGAVIDGGVASGGKGGEGRPAK